MPVVKVANPASLMLVNGGTKMRKRKSSTRRRKNPSTAARRKVTIRVNGKRGRRTTARRRRNPSGLVGVGILKDGAFVAVGSALSTFARPFIPLSFGGALGDALLTGFLGWGFGELTATVLKNPNAGKMITLGGIAAGVNTLMQNYNLTPAAIFAPRPVAVPANAVKGMNDIVALPRGSSDPYWGTSPNLAGLRQRTGMNNIVAVPRG